jgi:hypothetical protein
MTVVERTALALCTSFGGCAGTGSERHHLMCAYLRPAQDLADKGLLAAEQ